ncbi:acyl-CoA dehydratase activase-related protein [Orenia marismortui]|uniref:Putative nucleotide-binding protein (Sugar kinase/HSP70/actin superfamily) n=1 Tax=Orenia marismortui TaxID=46469 RepID=A0A4R8GY11_9FIRM|nr:acyl-CoA dehydratase activase-related protein [Orenia marismortui]TDX51166.1 putative nucleotide-binding protein (sugar kinase/HSP70/actin superfamily) [Orenia marismortui]
MKTKIGIPQALLYHRYYPAWNRFFKELDCEIVNSKESTKNTVDAGIRLAVDEACLPVKLFLGHVHYLKDKVDYLFIPRIVSINSKEYLCPKFMGLPDMVKYNISNLPPIIDTTINLRNNRLNLIKAAREVGDILGKNFWQVNLALWKAWKELKAYRCQIRSRVNDNSKYKIGVLGHEYIIYDKHISMNLINKLKDMGVEVITAEMLSESCLKDGTSNLSKDLFWTLSKNMMGAAYHFFDRNDIDGIIQLTAFGCGPDSLIGEMIEREAKRRKKQPFMTLNLDEHTGEAGLVTRLEAFVDMIQWEGV